MNAERCACDARTKIGKAVVDITSYHALVAKWTLEECPTKPVNARRPDYSVAQVRFPMSSQINCIDVLNADDTLEEVKTRTTCGRRDIRFAVEALVFAEVML